MQSMWSLSLGLVLLGSVLGGVPAHAQWEYALQPGSVFWIDGTTSVGGFTCMADQAAGVGVLDGSLQETGIQAARTNFDAVVAVPVRVFDCGLRQMNRDLYEALRGAEHPAIRFTLTSASITDTSANDGWATVDAWGTLSLAGAERPLRLQAEGRTLPDGRLRLRGSHALRMTDFGVAPPAGPLGLVRARDHITVRFDLIAAPSN